MTGRKSEAGANFGARRTEWEEAYLPLKGGALRLGPLAAKVGPESSIRTLYVYWGLTLVRMDQILPRGALVTLGGFLHILNLSQLGPRFGRS